MRTRKSLRNTPGLRLVGEESNGNASTPYGPVKAGLTTSPVISKEVQLLELLNSLERQVEILAFKYLEVLDIFESDILPRVERFLSSLEKDGTKH